MRAVHRWAHLPLQSRGTRKPWHWPILTDSVDANRTYPSDLPRRRTQCDAQTVKAVVTVICLLEVEVHEVWLLVAPSVVVVALVEPDVANQEPLVTRAVPSCSTPVPEFLGVERGEPVHSLQIDVPDATGLAGIDAPPSLLSKVRAATSIAVNERDPDRVVVLVLKFEPHYDSRLCVVGAGWIKRWRR